MASTRQRLRPLDVFPPHTQQPFAPYHPTIAQSTLSVVNTSARTTVLELHASTWRMSRATTHERRNLSMTNVTMDTSHRPNKTPRRLPRVSITPTPMGLGGCTICLALFGPACPPCPTPSCQSSYAGSDVEDDEEELYNWSDEEDLVDEEAKTMG